MKTGDSTRYYMKKGRCKGQYKYESEDCLVSLKYRTASENGLHAVWVDSKIKGTTFSGTFAVGLETLPVREIEGYMSDFRLYTIVPVVDGIAMIGHADKFNSPLAVNYEFDGMWSLHEGGRLAFVCTDGRKLKVTAESGTYEPTTVGMLSVVKLLLLDRHVKLS